MSDNRRRPVHGEGLGFLGERPSSPTGALNSETKTDADACSVQRSCSAVGFTGDVGSERFGLFDFDGFDDDIKAFAAKHKYRVVTENFVTLQLIRSINRLTSELANRNNRSDNSEDA